MNKIAVPFKIKGFDTWFSASYSPQSRGLDFALKVSITRTVIPVVIDKLSEPSIEALYNAFYEGSIPVCAFCNKNLCHIAFDCSVDKDQNLIIIPRHTEIFKCKDTWCAHNFRHINPNSVEYVSKAYRVSYEEAISIIHKRNPTPFYFHPETQTVEEYRRSQTRDREWYVNMYGEMGDEKFKHRSDVLKEKLTKQSMIERHGQEYVDALGKLKANTLENFIARYGEEIGTLMYDQHKDVCKQSKENFIKRWGKEEGERKWEKRSAHLSRIRSKQYLVELYGKDEADRLCKERYAHTLEKMIRKYGDVEGKARYEEYLQWSKGELQWYVKKYGENDGLQRWQDRWNKQAKNQRLAIVHGNYGNIQSKAAIRFFSSLCEELLKLGFRREDMIFYDGSQSEHKISIADGKSCRVYFLDFYMPALKLNIEFNGEFWHANNDLTQKQISRWNATHPISYEKSLEKENQRIDNLNKLGICTEIVWESEDQQASMQKCIHVILERRNRCENTK